MADISADVKDVSTLSVTFTPIENPSGCSNTKPVVAPDTEARSF
jgi:hypothetical protein